MSDKLKGGKADKLTPQNIANKFNVPLSDIQNQIKKGIDVEMEHTNDRKKVLEIVMDHLTEFPDYYDRLIKMERNAKKETFNEVSENTRNLIKRFLHENLINYSR